MKPEYTDIYKIKSSGQALSWYLIHSFLYYVEGESIISDDDWLQIGKWLKDDWDNFEHRHKHLVDINSITSTAFYIREYPSITISTAYMIRRWHTNCIKRKKLAKKKKL